MKIKDLKIKFKKDKRGVYTMKVKLDGETFKFRARSSLENTIMANETPLITNNNGFLRILLKGFGHDYMYEASHRESRIMQRPFQESDISPFIRPFARNEIEYLKLYVQFGGVHHSNFKIPVVFDLTVEELDTFNTKVTLTWEKFSAKADTELIITKGLAYKNLITSVLKKINDRDDTIIIKINRDGGTIPKVLLDELKGMKKIQTDCYAL